MPEQSSVQDRGFTLTEVVIVVVILGVISVAIAGVFSVIVRTAPATEARADDARSLLGLSTWLPADVNSTPMTPVGSVDVEGAPFDRRPGASSTCASGNEGTNLLKLRWTEAYGSTVRYDVSYRLQERPSGWHIVRVSCTNGGTAAVLNMTAALGPITGTPTLEEKGPVTVTWKTRDGRVVGAVFRVTTIDGEHIRIDTVSQSPVETLPPLSSVELDPTTTTSEPPPTTTTLPPSVDGVCSLLADVTAVDQSPTPASSPLLRDATDLAAGALTSPVEVVAVLRASILEELAALDLAVETCATLQLEYETGLTVVARPVTVEAVCSAIDTEEEPEVCTELTLTATAELPADPTEQWATAMAPNPPHPARLVDGGGATIAGTETGFFVDEDPATVPVACTASFVSVSPSSVHNTNNANSSNTNNVSAGPLLEPVTVTVSKGENCQNLGLEYVHNPPSTGWKPFGASSQVVLERTNQEVWSDGNRVLRLRDGQGGPVLAETTLTIL